MKLTPEQGGSIVRMLVPQWSETLAEHIERELTVEIAEKQYDGLRDAIDDALVTILQGLELPDV